MQGRKGVGRYAASVLGKDLLLETVSVEGEKTEVYIDWSHFEEIRVSRMTSKSLLKTSETADCVGHVSDYHWRKCTPQRLESEAVRQAWF